MAIEANLASRTEDSDLEAALAHLKAATLASARSILSCAEHGGLHAFLDAVTLADLGIEQAQIAIG